MYIFIFPFPQRHTRAITPAIFTSIKAISSLMALTKACSHSMTTTIIRWLEDNFVKYFFHK